MWVKRTEPEIAEERQRQRRRHFRQAVTFGAFVFVMLTCLFGWREAGRRGRVVVPVAEYSSRILFAVAGGVVAGLAFFKWNRQRRMMICPNCEATKYQDAVTECSCGGHFEMMEVMKYVA